MKNYSLLVKTLFTLLFFSNIYAQIPIKSLHYAPHGSNGYKCLKLERKFNRALYGGNSAFRVEAGDFPEFALYLPGMGGNCKIGIINGTDSKWITETKAIETIYENGEMLYEIKDEILQGGKLKLTATATYTHEAFLLKINYEGKAKNLQIVVLYGGVTGKKFSRDGDIGADPESSFYLKPDYCQNNQIDLQTNRFTLSFNPKDAKQKIAGLLPIGSSLAIVDANVQTSPLATLKSNPSSSSPCLIANFFAKNLVNEYIFITKSIDNQTFIKTEQLENLFEQNRQLRRNVYQTIQIHTPDSLINPLGQALSLAADAIWESPTYMHGAIAWRMRLPAWRGPYAADVLGQHQRAKEHFSAYAKSQVQDNFPLASATPDTVMHGAREVEKIGSGIFTEGYICRNPNGDIRAHHYDMNLIYIDQLLNHFNWTGDTTYVREMWPVIEKHLAWEKHNFDADNDGLYDAYCCIWASDALQYSGGGVTHASAYNYRAFKSAAELAKILGKNAETYTVEAQKIYSAMQKNLWLNETGCFAEYKDILGLKLTHPSAALWTVYHAIDAAAASATQQYSMTQYVERQIPHIPFRIPELQRDFYLLSTSNWQPYTWSINNVALGENLHTALAFWQAQNQTKAYEIWQNTLIESLYTSASPGGLQQLSSFDAVRGELYRDFADGIGMTARSLVEGLYGIRPRLLQDSLVIQPGFPQDWNFASLKTNTIDYDFKKQNTYYQYKIKTSTSRKHHLALQLTIPFIKVSKVLINGQKGKYHWQENAVELPILVVESTTKSNYFEIEVWFDEKSKKTFTPQEIEVLKTKTEANLAEETNTSGIIETIDISTIFNDKLNQIFKHQYLSPRPTSPTLQLPYQGIGNWCYPLINPTINDSGLRQKATQNAGEIKYQNIRFRTPADTLQKNIAFVSKWDNFPDTLIFPIKKQGKFLHLLMAGTTNPMQTQMENGKVVIAYADKTTQEFALRNPDNWWPIEQDYFYDGVAFSYDKAQKPIRLLLKTGEFVKETKKYTSIKGFSNYGIDGGAANLYRIKLSEKPIATISLMALCNDVIIGIMAVSIEK